MFVFRKIWRALLSCYLRFEIRTFALLPTNYNFLEWDLWSTILIFIPYYIRYLRYIRFLLFSTITSTSKVVTSWWVLMQEVQYVFEHIFWIVNHLFMKLIQLIDTVQGNFSGNILHDLEDWVFSPGHFLIYQPNSINQKPNIMGLCFIKNSFMVWIL